MPKGIDWIHFIYVNLGFILQVMAMYLYTSINQIKADWPTYRCNTMFMPLSDNLEDYFVYCVQNMQTNLMGYLLEPLTYITSNLSSMGGGFTDTLNAVRNVISNIRSFLSSIADSIMGVFLNLMIEFQKITIGIRDLVGKLIGVMVVLMYMMDGSIKTMQSAWSGPPGQLVKALSGSCFHPDTKVKLQNGKWRKMKNIHLGDTLESGSVVTITMKITKTSKDPLYQLLNGKGQRPIYVTGSHFILYKDSYIMVEDHPDAVLATDIPCEYLSCLVTSDHQIRIGERQFYDWEDYELKKGYAK